MATNINRDHENSGGNRDWATELRNKEYVVNGIDLENRGMKEAIFTALEIQADYPRQSQLIAYIKQQQNQQKRQIEQPPPTKRQRELQKWGEIKHNYTVKAPTAVPLPTLVEESQPPRFLAPEDWLKNLCQEVRVQFDRQESENPRVSPVAVVRCSRGGKTRALHELAGALGKDNGVTDAAIIYVSFNGHTQLSTFEKQQPLEALCRRILYAATGGQPNDRAFDSFALSAVFTKEDVAEWLGSSNCILLIDELNLIESTMNGEFADFLKHTFLLKTGRALVFSSHVVSVNNTLMQYMNSPSDREVKVKKLPCFRNISKAKELLNYPTLSPHLALYLGLFPALYYGSMKNNLPHARRAAAIQQYVDAGVTRENVESLLSTILTGMYSVVPQVFRELMDIEVVNKQVTALWIPYHMASVIENLSWQSALPIKMRRCLRAIHEQFENFRTHKIQSSDGWEALFIVILLTRCITKSFCELVPLHDSDYEVGWNEPFLSEVLFGCEGVEQFVSGIPVDGSVKSISIYFPSHAKFETYDVILAVWGDNRKRKLFGYQLKEGRTIPKVFPLEGLFAQSFVVRGLSTKHNKGVRKWTIPSEGTLDTFFGVSAKNWSPKCWAMLS